MMIIIKKKRIPRHLIIDKPQNLQIMDTQQLKYVNSLVLISTAVFLVGVELAPVSFKKSSNCQDSRSLYQSLKGPTADLIRNLKNWQATNKKECDGFCGDLIQIGTPPSYNTEDLILNEHLGRFKAFANKATDSSLKIQLTNYWRLLESIRDMTYNCVKGKDQNVGKSTPEPWFEFHDLQLC